MKSIKDVEQNKINYHRNAKINTVHRASLLIPEIKNCTAAVSFLNHFLIKRGYERVGCKITAIDLSGHLIESKLFEINEPKVYSFVLSGMFNAPVSNYLLEFYSAENLFIPFPAVIINHYNDGFINIVHSYNRPLSDAFEDDSINKNIHAESSIDLFPNDNTDNFAVFTAGPLGFKGKLKIELCTSSAAHAQEVDLNLPKFTNHTIFLKKVFPALGKNFSGTLKIHQPLQPLFYGRMLTGTINSSGEFSANHSYYDCSGFEEYWDNPLPSYRNYPFFSELENKLRFYPILSPGKMNLEVVLHIKDRASLKKIFVGTLVRPGGDHLEVDINQLATKQKVELKSVCSFTIYMTPVTGNTPTRTHHQLVYGAGSLESSINVSLASPNHFKPKGKRGITWIQIAVSKNIKPYFALCCHSPEGIAASVELAFYNDEGHIRTLSRSLPTRGVLHVDVVNELELDQSSFGNEPSFIWIMAKSERDDLIGYSISQNTITGHCTGEHGF